MFFSAFKLKGAISKDFSTSIVTLSHHYKIDRRPKDLLEDFKQHLIKLGLEGPHLHKQFKNLRIFINWVKGNEDEQEME